MNKFTLGIDIGGTTTKIGLVSRNSKGYELIGYREIPTICGKENINRMLDRIKQEIYLMKKKRTIHSCGIGIAALVNVKKGFVIFAPNVLWSGVNLKKIVQKKFQIPTVIENDANVATVGIYHKIIKPKYPDIKDIVCFTLGTGIGGGIILQGQLLYGNLSTAAEIGHMVIDINGKKCGCGSFGCLERFVGARWFTSDVIEFIEKNNPNTILHELVNRDLSAITPKILYDAAEKNDKFALQQWQKYGEHLAVAVSNLINTINPQMIAFTGGVSKASKFFLPHLKEKLKKILWPAITGSKHVIHNKIKYLVVSDRKIYGILGAGILAYENFLTE